MIDTALTLTGLTDRLAKAEVYQSIHFAVNETLVATSTLRDAMPRILRTIGLSLNWQVGMYWVKGNENPPCLHLASAWQSPTVDVDAFMEISRITKFCEGESLPGRVWASGTPVWFTDFGERQFIRSPQANKTGLQAALAFPIYCDLEVIGVIEFFDTHTDEPVDSHLLDVLTNVGYRIGQFHAKRHLQRELHESNARYVALVNSSDLSIIVCDEYGSITEWNTACEAMFGWRGDEVRGRNLTLIIPERFRTPHLAGMERIRRDDHTVGSRIIGKVNELRGLHKDGHEFDLSMTLSTWNVTGHRFFGAILRRGAE